MIKGRVIEAHRTNFIVSTEAGHITATVRGNFHEEGDFPKVGDYVSLNLLDAEKGVIEEIDERKSVIKRKAADSEEEQIIVTNVDTVFIVMGLDRDFNLSRLERYLLMVQQSGIQPVIVLNKADLITEDGIQVQHVKEVSGDAPVLLVSAKNGDGMSDFYNFITTGTTAVLLGSSGAGKSTITNWLLGGDVQAVNATKADDNRGRHTTTTRYLFTLANGAFLIDTPGMRELGIVENDADDEQLVFEKIERFAALCKFRNCDHEKSQGCAVLEALESGDLTERELDNYHKLIREREFRDNKDTTGANLYKAQNLKRQKQKDSALNRKRLSGGR